MDDGGFTYVRSLAGIFKIVTIICSLCAFICGVVLGLPWQLEAVAYFNIMQLIILIYALAVLILRITNMLNINWSKLDCIMSMTLACLEFSATSLWAASVATNIASLTAMVNYLTMGQNTSVPSRGRRRSLRTFRSPFPRRSSSHQSSLSATFAIAENEQKIEQLNVNLASEEELMTLPGITRPIAQSIVEHRRVIGRFKKVEDLALVSGIGAERLDKIRPEICVNKRSCASSRAQSMDSLKSTDSTRTGLKNSQKIVDINAASVFDLQCVHGMTQELAANIIHYRDKKGLFKSVEVLLKVKGIDALRLSSIRGQLTVNATVVEEPKVIKNGLTNASVQVGAQNGGLHTPKHRKSLSAPMKFSLSLGNGLSKAPINDIFDLLSAYSYRPIVEEEFKYERNGEKAIRIATWNLDRLCLQKAENLGFREVVCRTILENRFSLVAIQDVHDVSALKLICDELNKPNLRRVSEWKDNSRAWNYCLSDIHCMLRNNIPGVGFIYDSTCGGIDVEFLSQREVPLPQDNGARSEATMARFHIGDIDVSLLNVYMHAEYGDVSQELKECFENKDDMFLILGDFTEFNKHIEELTSASDFLNIVPLSTNTSSMSINPHFNSTALRYADNILLGGAAKLQYTGVGGVVRQGLTHMAIPRGWSWGGPASEHCPVWCEMYVRHVTSHDIGGNKPADTNNMLTNGTCVKGITELNILKEVKAHIKSELKQNSRSAAVANVRWLTARWWGDGGIPRDFCQITAVIRCMMSAKSINITTPLQNVCVH
ncbi:hypothetical protein CBL_06696 [Carabus blaptoides fortunei]